MSSQENTMTQERKIEEPKDLVVKVATKKGAEYLDIKKGMIITNEMLAIKRPATGLHPKNFYSLLGKRAVQDIQKDQIVKDDMFE